MDCSTFFLFGLFGLFGFMLLVLPVCFGFTTICIRFIRSFTVYFMTLITFTCELIGKIHKGFS